MSVIKCKYFLEGGALVGEGSRWTLLPISLSGNISSLSKKLLREEEEGGVPGSTSNLTSRVGGQDSGPVLHKFMQGYKSRFKINIASKTLTNNFLFQTKKEPQHYQCRVTVMTVSVTLPEEKLIKLHS
jgi:hypothetical protein